MRREAEILESNSFCSTGSETQVRKKKKSNKGNKSASNWSVIPNQQQQTREKSPMPFNKVRDRVYIRDERFEWLPAIIRKIVDDRILVEVIIPDNWNDSTVLVDPNEEFPKKEKRWVDLKDYYNHCLPPQNARYCRDLADLEHLHEATILYTIKQRHYECQPYTRVGEIIVAVNPCQWIHSLYTKEEQQFYIHKFAILTSAGDGKYPPCFPRQVNKNKI